MFGVRDISKDPQAPTALCALADLKSLLGITDAGKDAELTSLILSASAAIEDYCNAIFAQRTVTETLYLQDSIGTLMLAYNPVLALASITADGAAQTLTDYRLLLSLGAVRRLDGTPISAAVYEVTYTAGYAPGTLPPAVVKACLTYCRDLYNLKSRVVGIKQEGIEGVGSRTYDTAAEGLASGPTGASVPHAVAAMLGPYVTTFSP